MSDEAMGYEASHIQVLWGPEAIRKRPGMYVGSVGERGLYQMVFEVVGRAVNEVLAGRAGSVDVALTPEDGVRVTDDGPGIPVDVAAGGGPTLETLLTRCSEAEPDGRHAAAVSLFGRPELCVANALSSRLTAEVRREGVRWVQEYARGIAVTPLTAVGSATGSGTTITFRPDAAVFDTTECSYAVLAERFRELAHLNHRLDISLTDERPPGASRSVRYRFRGGARDFVSFLDAGAGTPAHPSVIGFETEEPRMAGTLEVALRWRASPEERVRSFANSRPTPDGGTHAEGFRDGTAAAINAYARRQGLLTASDPDLSARRIGEGLTAVVSVKLDQPEFLGATANVLGGTAVRGCVGQAVRDHLSTWLEEHPEQAAAVLDQILPGARQV
ncbi:ATP-binding protein [Streptomyces sp. NPDC000229]|uniref:ATP-binding protein n=1 Tax=Streptomyces sp. NPDC000229 TaxID=3154247 RepID=UPI0033195A84